MDVPYMSLDYVSLTHCMVQLCGTCLYLVLIVCHADPSDVVLLFKKCIVYLFLCVKVDLSSYSGLWMSKPLF